MATRSDSGECIGQEKTSISPGDFAEDSLKIAYLPPTVNIKVKMDCDGCERRVKNAVSSMKGVKSVEMNRKIHKVTVSGYVEPKKVLKRVERTGKKAEIWPYVPYNMVAYPYAVGVYDKKAPAGFVRKSEQSQPEGTRIRTDRRLANSV